MHHIGDVLSRGLFLRQGVGAPPVQQGSSLLAQLGGEQLPEDRAAIDGEGSLVDLVGVHSTNVTKIVMIGRVFFDAKLRIYQTIYQTAINSPQTSEVQEPTTTKQPFSRNLSPTDASTCGMSARNAATALLRASGEGMEVYRVQPSEVA